MTIYCIDLKETNIAKYKEFVEKNYSQPVNGEFPDTTKDNLDRLKDDMKENGGGDDDREIDFPKAKHL